MFLNPLNPWVKYIFQSALRGGKLHFRFFFIGASATKGFARSRLFRYGLPYNISSKGQITKTGRGEQCPSPWVKGLTYSVLLYITVFLSLTHDLFLSFSFLFLFPFLVFFTYPLIEINSHIFKL